MARSAKQTSISADYTLKAVIDVGSTSIRMAIAQIFDDGHFETLDALHQNVAIGSDTFSRGTISIATIEEAVTVLRSFATVLREYGIDLRKDVRAVATSAVREAGNRDQFLDRIYMASGINLEVIEGAEVNRLTFLGIHPLLTGSDTLQIGRLLVVEVGGGSTELLGLDEGSVSFAHTYRLGAYRLRETMESAEGHHAPDESILDAEIDSGVRQFRDAVGKKQDNLSLLLLGGEARLAVRALKEEANTPASLSKLKVSDLARLAAGILKMETEQVMRRYDLAYEDAQSLGPALQIYAKMGRALGLRHLFVCSITLRDGLLAEAASGNAWSEGFVQQILHSAREIGKRYDLDLAHADCVTDIALSLFSALQDEHQLEQRHKVLLSVAGLLHDVGMFISASSHHKHSAYIIRSSDIFGLDGKDVQLTALVARYHRRALPRPGHPEYGSLSREDRLVVNKLAAILRAADALDRSHTQAIRNVRISVAGEEIVIQPAGGGDFSAEKRALAGKGKMFEQVYGRPIVLRTKRKQV